MKAKLMMSDLAKVMMVASLALPGSAIANGESKFGLQTPQTPVAHELYDLHAITLGICIVIAVVVFGLMFYTILRHRRSVGHEAKQFDSNKKSGKPYDVTVGAGKVIKGWDEGLMGMKVGGVRKLIVPYQLGYGEKGGQGIPPKTDLHFEIELVRIK